jgi:hypothetical protein
LIILPMTFSFVLSVTLFLLDWNFLCLSFGIGMLGMVGPFALIFQPVGFVRLIEVLGSFRLLCLLWLPVLALREFLIVAVVEGFGRLTVLCEAHARQRAT